MTAIPSTGGLTWRGQIPSVLQWCLAVVAGTVLATPMQLPVRTMLLVSSSLQFLAVPCLSDVLIRCVSASALLCLLSQALPAYQRALDLNPMSEEIIGKVRELRKKVPAQPKVSQVNASLAGHPCQRVLASAVSGAFWPVCTT